MQHPYLVGEQTYLRPLEPDDAPAFTVWLNDAEINRFLRRNLPISLRAERQHLEGIGNDNRSVVLGIANRADDRLMGATGLHHIAPVDRHAEFGILIGDKTRWDRGHGTEATALMLHLAFHRLNLNRVWLHVYADNPRGMRVYEKLGFRREGVLRQDTFREGKYHDTIVMGLLRDEWEPGAAPQGTTPGV